MIARRLIVRGTVQGVWYRGWAVDQARALALDGWVRNRRDGTVEMVLAGSEDAVAKMIERCREGPPAAHVTAIDVEQSEERPSGFEQRSTA